MNRDKLIVLSVFGLVLAVVLCVPLFRLANGQPEAGATASAPARLNVNVGEFRGLWLQLHRRGDDLPYEQYIREVHDTGANTICLTLAGVQENGASSDIFIDQRKAPDPVRLAGLFKLAKQELKMRVVFMPIVLLDRPRADEWRGKISPEDWTTWWNQYEDFITFYAELARRNDVDLFIVGSELISTEKDETHWRALIEKVRGLCHWTLDQMFRQQVTEAFPGVPAEGLAERLGVAKLDDFSFSQADPAKLSPEQRKVYDEFAARHRPMLLSYSANWDHYEVPKWWDALDAVGMTSYYNVNPSEDVNPTVDALAKEWEKIRDKISAWQRTVNKPILFTEVGWPSVQGGSITPWDYYRAGGPAPVEQDRCMQSFLRTFADQPWVAGVLIWKWRGYPGEEGDKDDKGYVPINKPVMKTIEQYFATPPRTTSQPSAQRPSIAATQPADTNL